MVVAVVLIALAVRTADADESKLATIKGPYSLEYAYSKEDAKTHKVVEKGKYLLSELNGRLKVSVTSDSGRATSLYDGTNTLSVDDRSENALCFYGLRFTGATIGLRFPFNYESIRTFRSLSEYKTWLATYDLSKKPQDVQDLLEDIHGSNLSICTDSNSPKGRHTQATADWDANDPSRMVQLKIGRNSNPGSTIVYSNFQKQFGAEIPGKVILTRMDLSEPTSSPHPLFVYTFDLVRCASESPEFDKMTFESLLKKGIRVSYNGADGAGAGLLWDPTLGSFQDQINAQLELRRHGQHTASRAKPSDKRIRTLLYIYIVVSVLAAAVATPILFAYWRNEKLSKSN